MRRNFHTKLKRKALERDAYVCQLALIPECRGDMLPAFLAWKAGQMTRRRTGISVDHIKPLSKGGTWTLENLQAACVPCNQAKGNKEEIAL